MAIVKINGKTYQGNNLQISNNKVYIDGKLQNTEKLNRYD